MRTDTHLSKTTPQQANLLKQILLDKAIRKYEIWLWFIAVDLVYIALQHNDSVTQLVLSKGLFIAISAPLTIILLLWQSKLQNIKYTFSPLIKKCFSLIVAVFSALILLYNHHFFNIDIILYHQLYLASTSGAIIVAYFLLLILSLSFFYYQLSALFIHFIVPAIDQGIKAYNFYQTTGNYSQLVYCISLYLMLYGIGIALNRLQKRASILRIFNDNYLAEKNIQIQEHKRLNIALQNNMQKQIIIESELIKLTADLERQVAKRTQELQQTNQSLLQSKQNLEFANTLAKIGSWEWDIQHKKFTTINSLPVLGYSDEEMSYNIDQLYQLIHPEDIEHVSKAMELHFKGKTSFFDSIHRIKQKNNTWEWVHGIGQVIERDSKTNHVTKVFGLQRNITLEKEAAEKLKLSSIVFNQATQGFFILDKDFNLLSINKHLSDMVGFNDNNPFEPKHIFHYVQLSKQAKKEYLDMVKTLVTDNSYEGESIIHDVNGVSKPIWLHINGICDDVTGLTTHYVGTVSDLTQRKASEYRVDYLTNYDSLTDLANRHLFAKTLHNLIVAAPENNQTFALFRINIDRFKTINNSLGATEADLLLKGAAIRLKNTIGNDAYLVARLNGDDFAVILTTLHNDKRHIYSRAQKLIEVFNSPFTIKKQEITANISIGIALYPIHGRHVDDLLSNADKVLSDAKQFGGHSIKIFNEMIKQPSMDKLKLEQELRKALNNENEIVVYFQPKASLVRGDIIGFEALVRWNHPEKGMLMPDDFISMATDIGLISTLGEIVLRKTCQQIAKWNKAGFNHLRISINVVVQQIKRGDLLASIDKILKETAVNASALELEITESYLMNDTEDVTSFLSEIKKRGIEISLDDFGTGYSCLSYLGKFSINTIKIDRSFIEPIGSSISSPHQESIVSAILALGHSLGLHVIAEGIETQAQFNFLRSAGCDSIQGYLISKPLSIDDANKFLTRCKQADGCLVWQNTQLV